ncbi:Ycf51 family protein [Pleurocapsales cyanobacterium LEGE 06147]|nr:Ycf51 family protein [Pleurocapsales cyanobacterium LEGE 06147]
MKIPTDLLIYAQWSGILTIVSLVMTILAFVFGWGFRFRLVGVTGFMGLLTIGIFTLKLGLITHTEIPGARRYSLVYDNGANQVVIAVPPQVEESQIEPTLRQAASDLYSPGRNALGGDNKLTIRLRTILHPEPGISRPLYLGQIRRSLFSREDENMEVKIFTDNLAQLPKTENGEQAKIDN